MRYAARVDANQEQIVSALRAAGAYVWIIGIPVDLLVGYRGHTFLVEIKSTNKGRLTPLQADFFDAQSAMEYTKRMSDYHADRIKRLTIYIESAE